MTTSFEEWKASMAVNQQKTMQAIENTVNSAAKEMFERIIERTPVGNPSLWHYKAPKDYEPGTLKASWEANFNNSGRDAITGQYISKKHSSVADSNSQQWSGIKLNINTKEATITINNRQPYAWRVEYGSWSTQAPAGMMRITVNEYESILNTRATENKL